jgi:hypothetical protein
MCSAAWARRSGGSRGAERRGLGGQYSTIPVLIKLPPSIGDILEPGVAAVEAGAHGRR